MIKSAGALIVHNKKVLMLLRDDSPQIPSPNCWQLIGGHLEVGESPREALIREVKEETHLQIEANEPIKIGKIVILGKQEHFLYWIKLAQEKVADVRLGDEGQAVDFFSVEELEKVKMGQFDRSYFQKVKAGLKNLMENEILDRGALDFNEKGVCVLEQSVESLTVNTD